MPAFPKVGSHRLRLRAKTDETGCLKVPVLQVTTVWVLERRASPQNTLDTQRDSRISPTQGLLTSKYSLKLCKTCKYDEYNIALLQQNYIYMWAYRLRTLHQHKIVIKSLKWLRCHESSPGFKPRANRITRADALQNITKPYYECSYEWLPLEILWNRQRLLEIPHCRFLSWYQPKIWWGARVSWKFNSERQ
jgi:hypothetical protein